MVKQAVRGVGNAADNPVEICIVEDDNDLRDELTSSLEYAGFRVRGFPGSRELYASLLAEPCDVVILDIGLPGEDGFSIAERLHGLGTMGIIVLTARGDTEDRIRALTGGADCFLQKPVVIPELIATIRGLTRRLSNRPAKPSAKPDGKGDHWSLESDGWTLFAPSGIAVPLTAQERAFLIRLWECPGKPVSREDLASALDEDPYEYDFHRFDTLVSRLRQKAAKLGASLPLRTVRGKGYLLLPY